MIYLLDTHIVLWAAAGSSRLSDPARRILEDRTLGLMFSTVAIWEAAIKSSLGRDDFVADPRLLRRSLIENGYIELSITSDHAIAVTDLPPIHRDPFDRIQIAQARVEGLAFLTSDTRLADYGSPVELI